MTTDLNPANALAGVPARMTTRPHLGPDTVQVLLHFANGYVLSVIPEYQLDTGSSRGPLIPRPGLVELGLLDETGDWRDEIEGFEHQVQRFVTLEDAATIAHTIAALPDLGLPAAKTLATRKALEDRA